MAFVPLSLTLASLPVMAAAEEVPDLLLRGGLFRELLPEVERLLKSFFSHLESVLFSHLEADNFWSFTIQIGPHHIVDLIQQVHSVVGSVK